MCLALQKTAEMLAVCANQEETQTFSSARRENIMDPRKCSDQTAHFVRVRLIKEILMAKSFNEYNDIIFAEYNLSPHNEKNFKFSLFKNQTETSTREFPSCSATSSFIA